MKVRVRKLDGLPIEEPVLDDEGMRIQQKLADLVVREYEQTGTLTGKTVCDQVIAYETDISEHVVDD